MNRAAPLLLLAACGRIGFDAPDSGPGDARVDTPPADACTLGVWGAPRLLTGINTADTEFGATISDDGLRIYFDSDRPGSAGFDIYAAFRISTSDSFGGAQKLAGIDTAADENDSTMTADELDLVFSRQDASSCLYEATRAAIGDAWSAPQRLDVTCASNQSGGATLSADGLRLYFNDLRDGLDEGVIFMTERPTRTSPWGQVVPVAGLDGTDKGYASISGDELTLYYEQGTMTGLTIYQVTRATTSDPFGPPMRPPGFPTMADERDPDVTTDGHAMVFASNRGTSLDLYLVTRGCQ